MTNRRDSEPPPWARWRAAERLRLIAARRAISSDVRRRHAGRIAATLDGLLDDVSGLVVGVYWPIRGEPDLRRWVDTLRARGARCALPVVLEPRAPLVFRAWNADTTLRPGTWNIPVPVDDRRVVPQVLIVPVVGFDPEGYRLGYGGGFYDRTLAAATPRPRAIGVGYSQARMSSIGPQPHDVALDAVVTELGVVARPSHHPTPRPTSGVGSEIP